MNAQLTLAKILLSWKRPGVMLLDKIPTADLKGTRYERIRIENAGKFFYCL